MFNWTTTTIINSLKDYTTGDSLVKVWKGAEAGENGLKAGFSGQYPVIKIKRDHTFEARYISSIYKAIANDPILCELEINVETLLSEVGKPAAGEAPKVARLAFYVSLEGSEESIYANDWYQKGKPFSIGFEVTSKDTAETVAKKIKKNAEKFGIITYGKKIFDITIDGTTIVLKGTHEYQRFKTAAIAIDDIIDEIVVDYYEDGASNEEDSAFTLVNRGINGFGTYSQLSKDLRLPTAHNIKWLRIKEDETPIIGAKYNQYIINYCAPSMANPGFTVIGQHNMSATTHVFWVNQDVDADFQAALVEAGITPEEVNTVTEAAEATESTEAVKASVTLNTKTAAEAGTKYSANHEQKTVHTEGGESDKVTKA